MITEPLHDKMCQMNFNLVFRVKFPVRENLLYTIQYVDD